MLFTNHGNDADLALLPPLQDLDTTRQFNWGAAALSYLYYGIDLCVQGAHLKIGYKRAIEVQDLISRFGLVSIRSFLCLACSALRGTKMQGLYLEANMAYSKRYSHSTSDIRVFRHLSNVLNWDWQQQQRGKRIRRGSEPRAPDMVVIVSKPKHGLGASFFFILDHIGQPTQGMLEMHLVSPYRMSPTSCTHRVDMVPPIGWGQGMRRGGRAGHGAGRQLVIIEEIEESCNKDSKEMTSNMS
ncbi:hypothetical protein JCGZ_26516 [Jatropha curcas]|uniref:Aminotransferase-like plant mobile domain-containing protein n=1 Tax=Jatropha curcas TaxID=180498 RepID=A0A067JYR6_JATCU|nr:hypothetical protein JCGZ_26516 [Jatropha curcas]